MADSTSSPGPAELVWWFKEHGGELNKVGVVQLSEELGLGLVATEDIASDDHVMTVPISLCMTAETARQTALGEVLDAAPALAESDDEVLALHLMLERKKGGASFWHHYIRTLPEEFDTPLCWPEAEHAWLKGTMVGVLTPMMQKQVMQDWLSLHQPLVERFPDLEGLTIKDYMWALSSIWSRAFGFVDEDGRYVRCMVPVINAANHDPNAASSLADIVTYHPSDPSSDPSNGPSAEGSCLRLRAGKECGVGKELCILYGPYSNGKLLYSYGFVLSENKHGSVDLYLNVPPSDPLTQAKRELLAAHALTCNQPYDLSGTLRAGGWVSPALMATVRVIQMTQEDLASSTAERAFHGRMVSVQNEKAALASLAAHLRRKAASHTARIADLEDIQDAADLEDLEGIQVEVQGVHTLAVAQEDAGGSTGEEAIRQKHTAKARHHRSMALSVLQEERAILKGAASALDASLQALSSLEEAVAAGGAAADDLQSFQAVDSGSVTVTLASA